MLKIKIYIFVFTIIFATCILIVSPFFYTPKINISQKKVLSYELKASFKKKLQTSQTKNIHVYLDPATTPALLQMIDYIRQDENDIKIIAWERYYPHIQNQESYKNTFFFPNNNLIYSILSYIKEQEKNINIHLHFNLEHLRVYKDIFNTPIQESIKSIHIYEDASAHLLQTKRKDWVFDTTPYQKYLYYWGDMKKLCPKDSQIVRCPIVSNILKQVTPVNIDFNKIGSTLTTDEKEKIFKLAGFDYQKIKNQLQNKNAFIYILGTDWKKPNIATQLSGLKRLCTRERDWFFKYHPNKHYQPTHTVLNHLCPNIQQIDAHIPFELLLITGLKPKGVAGFSSSLFFNINSKDILMYIPRENDLYLPVLEQAKLINKRNTLSLEQQDINLKQSGIYKLQLNDDTILWTWKKDPQTMCYILENECFKILNETEKQISIQLPNNKTHTFSLIETYQYREYTTQEKTN